jgi:hypothetical protein
MTTLLAGKLLFNTLLAFSQLVVMFVWAWAVFRIDFLQHIPGFVVMGVCTSFAVSSFGMLLASICRTRWLHQSLLAGRAGFTTLAAGLSTSRDWGDAVCDCPENRATMGIRVSWSKLSVQTCMFSCNRIMVADQRKRTA